MTTKSTSTRKIEFDVLMETLDHQIDDLHQRLNQANAIMYSLFETHRQLGELLDEE